MPERRLFAGRPSGPQRALRHGRFRRDEGGQMLILTGVLLVMGFVVVGSTLVQVQTLEESTSRTARDSVLDVFDDVVDKFDQTLQSAAQKGDTNVESFQERSGHSADRMRDAAIGRGLYLTATLDPAPDNSLFWSDERCGAWSSKADGVIVGYERESRTETIVGAVYDLYATNGDQTITTKYYVKLYDCMLTTTTTYVDAYTKNTADTITDFTGMQAEGDNAHASFTEKLVLGPTTRQSEDVNPNTASKFAWENQGSIQHSDLDVAYHESTMDDADWLRFYVDAGVDTGLGWQNIVVEVDGWYTLLRVDDLLSLTVTYGGDTIGPFTVPVTNTDQPPGSYPLVAIPTNPQGGTVWSHDMLSTAVWEFSINEVAVEDAANWYIDSITITADRGTAWHELDVDFEFDDIPPIFDNHDLYISYRLGTHLEGFDLQVWDGTQWNTRVVLEPAALDTWSSTATTGAIPYRLTADEYNSGTPLFRIVDKDRGDAPLTEKTTFDVDYLKIVSEFIP